MTFVRTAFFPGGTAAHYAALGEAMGQVPVPEGRVAFLAGPTDGGWLVVQVWRSREELDAFNAGHLLPALRLLGDRGFPSPPEVRDTVAEDEAWGE